MDADDFCEDCEAEVEHSHGIQASRWSWMGPLILGVQFVEDCTDAASGALGGLKTLLCAHANYAVDRDAAREMEASVDLMSNADISE